MGVLITIRSDSSYCTYVTDQYPKALFEKAMRYLGSMRDNCILEQQETLIRDLYESIIYAIFSSNKIKKARLGLDVIYYLCYKILRSELVPDINKRDLEYESKVLEPL
ncbi:hypothetical protein FPOAC1_010194 [Fusarium poae]|jgi:hypothetical protein|uniref:hypothetical protein n=1 Tax=Fusarium poae TaxID=36050 RepID=UPI001CE7C545|nr:hypothetical protein FPOAC1_010194 [Fusarium poae]KAG8665399.1 hypothetical protein FPOAC1_010194 [Fusarium poae]